MKLTSLRHKTQWNHWSLNGGLFNQAANIQYLGLIIHNLPLSCTEELFYIHIFKRLNINTNSVKAFKVSQNKSIKKQKLKAYVYFDSEQNAREALGKIIGKVIHDKVLNCSFLIPPEDLKLKNNKNIYVKGLSSDISLSNFYNAMIEKGQVLSVRLKRDDISKNMRGYACFKTEVEAQQLDKKEIEINGNLYQAKLLKDDQKTNEVKKFNFGGLSKNIKLLFDSPLTQLEPIDYEISIKAQICEKFDIQPVSVFVWGKNARHSYNPSNIRFHELKTHDKISHVEKCKESTTDFITDQLGDIGAFNCYMDPDSNCPKLLNARCKAFVMFAIDSEASSFIYQFYSKLGHVSNFLFEGQSVTLNECVPNTKNPEYQKIIRRQIQLFPKKDKTFIYLGNIRNDVDEFKIKDNIEKNSGTNVLSIKLNSSSPRSSHSPNKFKYVTLQLKDSSKSEQFIANFKNNALFREQFQDIFNDNYKFANFLTPIYLREKEIKEKKRLEKINKSNSNSSYLIIKQQMELMRMQNQQYFGPIQNNSNQLSSNINMSFLSPNSLISPNLERYNRINYQGHPFQKNKRNFSSSHCSSQENSLSNNYFHLSGNNHGNNTNKSITNINQVNIRSNSEGRPNLFFNKIDNQQTTNINRKNNTNLHSSFSPEKRKPIQTPNQPPASIKPGMAPSQPRPSNMVLPKFEDLIRKSDEEKKAILGQYLYPNVVAMIKEEYMSFVPKIIGLILDFQIFSPQEIYELITNDSQLKKQIDDILELFEESIETESCEEVLALPPLQDINQMSDEEKKLIIGQHLYLKIMDITTYEQKPLIPKIIGMLLELFSPQKIYELITNITELQEQINKSIILIEESTKPQSQQQVLVPQIFDLLKKSEDEKIAILRQHLNQKIMAIIKDYQKPFFPKISEMLLDFKVFSLNQIYAFITDSTQLKRQIQQSIDLIQTADKYQNKPQVLFLPKYYDLIKKPDNEKKAILEHHLKLKIKALITEKNMPFFDKISDMVLNVQVFNPKEVYELINNKNKLKKKIDRAIVQIAEFTKPQSKPQVLVLPDLQDLITKSDDEKKTILKQHLNLKIKAIIPNEQKPLVPKIISMILDFEIYEFITNRYEMQELIKGSIELIQSKKNQSKAQIEDLPKYVYLKKKQDFPQFQDLITKPNKAQEENLNLNIKAEEQISLVPKISDMQLQDNRPKKTNEFINDSSLQKIQINDPIKIVEEITKPQSKPFVLVLPQWQDLIIKSDAEKRAILGHHLNLMIMEIIANEQKPLVPKISDMLLNFELFSPKEVYEFLTNRSKLKNQINEVIVLIKEFTEPQSMPQFIVLPDLQDLIRKSEEEKRTILEYHLNLNIMAIISNQQKPLIPKIIGMLLDFQVFSPQEIYEFIRNSNEMQEYIKKAIQIIEQSTTGQSKPKVQVLPKFYDLNKKTDKEKKSIFEQHLLIKIMDLMTEEQIPFLPKISDIILRFKAFNPKEIYGLITESRQLKKKIEDTITLIKESTKSQSNPQVLILPQFQDLLSKSDEQMRVILGQHLNRKIMAIITEEQKPFLNKIFDMLLDFKVFSPQQIYEFINDSSQLKKQIKDAIDLIQVPTKYQSQPQVLVLPKFQDLITMPNKEKRLILEQQLNLKIKDHITMEQLPLVPKITYILLQDKSSKSIYELITNSNQLKKVIKDVIDQIEEIKKPQSKPEVLVLPELQDIIRKSDPEKRTILGQHLNLMIMQIITNEQKPLFPKICDILLNFEVFSAKDIYEFITNSNKLKIQIKNAIEQIEESTMPQVLVLPKLKDLMSKSDEEKKTILEQHLNPKIMAIIANQQKNFAPKIIGMLLDFGIFSPDVVYELITNSFKLKEQINKAIELIEESSKSKPQVLDLPKFYDFNKKSDKEKRQILEQHLHMKIMDLITEEQMPFLPKISDMLLDFKVFSPKEIYELLSNSRLLKKKIEVKIEQIKQSSNS